MPEDVANKSASVLPPEIEALIPSGAQIYDFLMRPIEPELVSESIPTLKQKYAHESEEGKQKRLDRYNKAFAKYDEAYDRWMAGLRTALKEERCQAFKAAEVKVEREDGVALASLEKQFEKTKTSR